MIGIKYYRADASTFVIQTQAGKTVKQGKGLSFFYNAATSSIAAIPLSAQEAPFVFNLQTDDYQEVRVQGQISYRVVDATKTAEILNFTLNKSGKDYISEDPMRLNDRVIRVAQSIIQARLQTQALREVLKSGQTLLSALDQGLREHPTLAVMGIAVLEVSLTAILPNTETARALEAEAREAILKEADDAIYRRRISAVEQERTVQEAELQTEYSVQQKQQEIEAQNIANKRELMRGNLASQREQQQATIESNKINLEAQIQTEAERGRLVELSVKNSKQQADADAYCLKARLDVLASLPVETLKPLVMGQMDADRLMAFAMDNLSQKVSTIGELNLGPDMLTRALRKGAKS